MIKNGRGIVNVDKDKKKSVAGRMTQYIQLLAMAKKKTKFFTEAKNDLLNIFDFT